jgi:hypothetical protein
VARHAPSRATPDNKRNRVRNSCCIDMRQRIPIHRRCLDSLAPLDAAATLGKTWAEMRVMSKGSFASDEFALAINQGTSATKPCSGVHAAGQNRMPRTLARCRCRVAGSAAANQGAVNKRAGARPPRLRSR